MKRKRKKIIVSYWWKNMLEVLTGKAQKGYTKTKTDIEQ